MGRRATLGFETAIAAGLLACSAGESRPPPLGDCVGDDAACSPPTGGTGGGGGTPGQDGASNCAVNAGDSMCSQCASMSCCAQLGACDASTDCQNLMSCENACNSGACVTGCQQNFANGVTQLSALTSCLSRNCPVCTQLGIGDGCQAQANPCNAGLTCNGFWCTKSCTRASDCTGLGAGGGNALGQQNACIYGAASGNTCVPGCTTDSDCTAFSGTYCFLTTSVDGLSVSICQSSADAGND
jgi:hypothetical protein